MVAGANGREHTYTYIGRVDKEELEVVKVKWIWLHLRKNVNGQ